MAELVQPLGSARHTSGMKKLVHTALAAKYYYLVLIPLALLMFPNRGITHDTRLYVFDILNIVHDGIFANDLLTVAGTQHDYTLYSFLVAPLYAIASPWLATSAIFVVGQLIWFSGLFALISRFAANDKATFYALLSVILLPTSYFGFSVLSYAEPFATPRLVVEGLTLWALWCVFRRAYLAAAFLVVAAVALHPIMGLIAASLIVAILLQEARRWWWIFGTAAAAGVALVLVSGVVPLERFTATLTGDWFDVVAARAKYLFVSQWPIQDWARIVLATSTILPLTALYAGWQRRLVIAAAAVAVSGLLVSLIATDLAHNVLLSQIQTSRAIWFAYLLGNAGLGIVLVAMYRRSEEDGDAFLFLYVLAWTIGHVLWPIPGMLLGLIASGLAFARITGVIAGLPSVARRLIYLVSLLVLGFLAFFRIKFWLISYNRDAVFFDNDAYVGIDGFTQAELVIVAFVIFVLVRRRVRVPRVLAIGLLIVLSVWSVLAWDRRSPENRGLEGGYVADRLVAQIPPGAQVFWEGGAKGAWFLLGRPSYFGDVQGAGSVFAEPLAMEFKKRSRIAFAVDGIEYVDIWRPTKTLDQHKPFVRTFKQLSRGDLVQVCADAADLDFLVLSRHVDGAYVTVWYPRTRDEIEAPAAPARELLATRPMFLYRCADFR